MFEPSDNNIFIIHGNIVFERIGGYIKCRHEWSVCINLVNDIVYVASYTLPLCQILKQSGWRYGIYDEDMALQRFGDTECLSFWLQTQFR